MRRPIGSLWPDCKEDPQRSSTPWGAGPKVWSFTNQPQSRPEGLDLVSHPHRWIQTEMLKIPLRHWWETLMPCGWRMMFSHILCKNLSESEALHHAQWQVAVFGCHWYNNRSLAGGMHHLLYKGFIHRNSFFLPLTHRISGSSTRKKYWL